ncbi:putative aromatic acid decarboxylase [Geobacter sp. OR-1]|uniref:flavin prenyltransferase UbiX n=1 Tax=Geobacter sp. OR-1 TaxID=1266765 RepID=UPI000543AF31|nr:flavin prenyltransferase UbiX [Geobacter sp. OR-1]GAM11206.1 putative aromatic acid decarboxylase [Geobacter sp. OR-1]
MSGKRIIVAITGASGAIYGLLLIRELLAAGHNLEVLISRAGFAVLKEEQRLDWSGNADLVTVRLRRHFNVDAERLRYYADDDFHAAIASGSAAPDAMVFAPCSMGTVARVSAGISGNLLERAADVMIKERRPLLMVPRETPLSVIHLENMLRLAQAGVRIIPAMPGFYGNPQTVDDMVAFVVGKVLDVLGIEHDLYERWGGR